MALGGSRLEVIQLMLEFLKGPFKAPSNGPFLSPFWSSSRVHSGVPQGSILEFLKGSFKGPALFLLYINDLLDDIICNITIYADDTNLYSKCDQVFDLWQ